MNQATRTNTQTGPHTGSEIGSHANPGSGHPVSALASRCVMCGLCLPHCPTYRLARREADGPRGRISLAKALAEGDLDANPDLTGALDRCLACRRCEAVCPAGVEYGALISEARQLMRQAGGGHWLAGVGHWLVRGRRRITMAMSTLRLAQRLGLVWLAGRLWPRRDPGVRQALRELRMPPKSPRRQALYPATDGAKRGATSPSRVGFHLGCVTDALAPELADDAVFVLNRLGFEVIVERNPGCCGSLAHHAGRLSESADLGQRNVDRFSARNVDQVILGATGCSAHAGEHWPPGVRPVDLCQFLSEHAAWPPMTLPEQPGRVLIHLPCTQRFPLQQASVSSRLLTRIKGLRTEELGSGDGCCGAAGSYFLRHPTWSTQLRTRLLDDAGLTAHDTLVSANIGCAQHLANGLPDRQRSGRGLPDRGLAGRGLAGRTGAPRIRHPVNLLADALKHAAGDTTSCMPQAVRD